VPNKYHAKPLRLDGRFFYSQAEADYYKYLLTMHNEHEVVCQPKVELLPGIAYKPDFLLLLGAPPHYVDVKGVETERFRVIKKLWSLFGPEQLLIIKRGGKMSPWVVVDRVGPGMYTYEPKAIPE